VTNANEGDILVDQATNATVTTPDFIANQFPQLGSKEIQAGTAAYAGLGLSNIQLANLIVGECMFFYFSCMCCILC